MSLFQLDNLAKFGQVLSGASLLLAAIAAWVTYGLFHRRTLDAAWAAGLRVMYEEFWKDDKIARVRLWIASDLEYEKLDGILTKRLMTENNTLTAEENEVLELIDYFCALCARIDFFDRSLKKRKHGNLWSVSYGSFWIDKIKTRSALKAYIEKYWQTTLGHLLAERNITTRGQWARRLTRMPYQGARALRRIAM